MAYTVKRALFDLLEVQSQAGFPLEGVQVTYSAPTDPTRADLYGAGFHFIQAETTGHPGRVVVDETVSVALIVRVSDPAAEVETTDAEAERIADVLADVLDDNPFLDAAQEMTVVGLSTGVGDYDPILGFGRSTLGLEVAVQCLIS